MMAKVEVNGADAHPLWQWLKAEKPGLLGTEAIKWNFTKFLVGRDGQVLKRYAPQRHARVARAPTSRRRSRRRVARDMPMFEHVEPYAGDPILSLNEAFQKDPRPHKINLSIGIYFDDEGRIPVLDSVRQAEPQMLAARRRQALPADRRRGRLPRRACRRCCSVPTTRRSPRGRIATMQTVGSSGGLKVGADFLER